MYNILTYLYIGWLAVHKEDVLSHLCVLSYNVSHALHMYYLAIAVIVS